MYNYLSLLKISRVLFLFAIMFWVASCDTKAIVESENNPDGWPWKAVTIVFPGGGIDDLENYKKKLNINFVRLNVNVKRYAKVNRLAVDDAWKDAMIWSNSMLDVCERIGIRATVEINHFPLDPAIKFKKNSYKFWSNNHLLNEVVSTAGELAKQLSIRGNELAAYQILSEPVVIRYGRATTPPQWTNVLDRIIKEIRKFDKKRWIVVAPGPGGGPTGYKDFSPPSDPFLIWGVHMYKPHAFTHQGIKKRSINIQYPGMVKRRYWDKDKLRKALRPLYIFQQKYPGPVFVGEFSAVRWAEGGEQYIKDLSDIFNEYNWSWAYYSGTGWHGWNPNYNQNYPGDNKEDRKRWKNDYIGDKSTRWNTLRKIFGVNTEAGSK